jgi:hypothetical protein
MQFARKLFYKEQPFEQSRVLFSVRGKSYYSVVMENGTDLNRIINNTRATWRFYVNRMKRTPRTEYIVSISL